MCGNLYGTAYHSGKNTSAHVGHAHYVQDAACKARACQHTPSTRSIDVCQGHWGLPNQRVKFKRRAVIGSCCTQ